MASHLKWLVGIFLTLQLSSFSQAAEEQIVFKKQTITLAGKKITVEIAKTDAQHERGLMNRKKMGANEGMLFVFPDEDYRSFWMKNTLINLSIGYFDKQMKLIDVQEMAAMKSIMQKDFPTYPSKGPAMYALEMNEGWFKQNKIVEGAKLTYIEAK